MFFQRRFESVQDTFSSVIPCFVGGEECKPKQYWGPAIRGEWLLHYVLSGKGTYMVKGETFTVTKDQAFLIRPGEVTLYTADKDEPWKYVWIGLRTDMEAFQSLPYVIENKELGNVMRKYANFETLYYLNELHIMSLAWSVVACLSEDMYSDAYHEGHVERAVMIMEEQFMKNITVQSIAGMLNIDRSYFSKLFKQKVGVNPQQYLIEIRMKRALELLREDRYSVSVVAASVGYDDLFTFSRCFKRYYGVSPSSYKQL